ncbi:MULTISPECIES: universal stress protein [Bifidobacterium]|uniref:Universal stress protein n=1 Tax=Bifidobacterium myosotis TaxID=1630166 RepID=A0A261FN98_9BIFI|nr:MULTISPECIES: universal stress protein [Bifidobacterium]OZG60609.1 universal stress protein [Bifidobacterium myosotis]TPF93666.1 universal stress protein [Bifidobacterium sp. UTBIF-78]
MNEFDVDADIVVGVDGSDESFAALKWALTEASLTGQSVNAVFGWTNSWDMGSEPDSDEAWAKVRHDIANELRDWADHASQGIDFDPGKLKLTSVKASGTAALLQIGKDSQQIVVGRRSLGRVARWFMGSLSASLAEEAQVPVTVVRIAGSEDESVTDAIANALTPGNKTVHYVQPRPALEESGRPVVVGVDGSEASRRAFDFALHEARLHDRPLSVLFCWQLKDLGTVPGYENAVAPVEIGQRRAEEILSDLMNRVTIPEGVTVDTHAFHIPASKGLIAASRYASHLIVGSRGLSGLDAHFLGSVSRQIVNFAECTVTVVH